GQVLDIQAHTINRGKLDDVRLDDRFIIVAFFKNKLADGGFKVLVPENGLFLFLGLFGLFGVLVLWLVFVLFLVLGERNGFSESTKQNQRDQSFHKHFAAEDFACLQKVLQRDSRWSAFGRRRARQWLIYPVENR